MPDHLTLAEIESTIAVACAAVSGPPTPCGPIVPENVKAQAGNGIVALPEPDENGVYRFRDHVIYPSKWRTGAWYISPAVHCSYFDSPEEAAAAIVEREGGAT